jgi:hypothetical protein
VTRFGYATGSPPVAQPREPRVAQPAAQPASTDRWPHRWRAGRLSGVLLGAFTVAVFTVAASVGLTGCNPAGGMSVPDDGGGGDGGGPADHPAPPPHCFSPLVCDGDRVRACDHGVMGEVVENCGAGETCSEARCTSTACASAADRVGQRVSVLWGAGRQHRSRRRLALDGDRHQPDQR